MPPSTLTIKYMKLYANVRSEKACKGQGGNEFLQIDITDCEGDTVATIGLKPKRFTNDMQVLQIGYNGHFTVLKCHDMAEESGDFWGIQTKNKR